MSSTKLITFLLLVASSIFIHLSIDSYEATGQQLLSDPEFKKGTEKWQVFGTGVVSRAGDVIQLTNSNTEKSVVLSQTLPVDRLASDMILTVAASSDGTRGDPHSRQAGRLVVVSLRGEDKVPDYEIPSEVFKLDGTNAWQEYRRHIHVYPGVSALAVQGQLLDTSGRLSIRGLSLTSAVGNPYWPVIQALMLSLFVVFLIWLFFPLLRSRPLDWATVGGLIVVMFIVLFTTMPMSLKNEIYSVFREVAPALNDVLSWVREPLDATITEGTDILVGKDSRFFSVMHFLFFMTASILLFIGKSSLTGFQKFSNLVAVAISTESMQLFVMNRHGAIDNVLVDVAGIVAGITVVVVVRRLSSYRCRMMQTKPS